MKKAILATTALLYLFLCGSGFAADPNDEAPGEGQTATAGSDDEPLITLRFPLLSPLFAKTPVAVVDDEPITVGDLTRLIASTHEGRAEAATSAEKDYASLLERLVSTHLIVREARNIGLDETDAITKQIDSFSTDLLISRLLSKQLASVEPDEERVHELYTKMSREFLLTTIEFQMEKDILAFQEQHRAGADFHELAKRFIDEGRARGEIGGQQYIRLKDLLPQVGKAAFDMDVGSTIQIFTSPAGFLVFHVDDIRPYEDPALKEEARQNVTAALRRQKAEEYREFLEQKYVTLDEKLLEGMTFAGERTGFLWFRKQQPFDYQTLLNDDRVLARVRGDDSFTVTVADLARALQKKFFHGIEKALDRRDELARKKAIVLKNMLFEKTAAMEAVAQGINETAEYVDAVEEYTNSLLFEEFINKVVAPDVSISGDEVRKYYETHMDDFSTPKIFRMKSLVFSSLSAAESALDKLTRGADFQWVSANTPGQVDKATKGVLVFDNVLLSLTGLPEGLRKPALSARQGDFLLYSSGDDYHYVISIAKVFPPKPKDYEEVREAIGRILSNQKVKELIDDWSAKLREAYDTRIFVTRLDD